ncbi:hypothetical protein B0H12DRAFT_1129245 [Mycena haematopus]|nr:hypothetical protein B0H12DRAFT_1129245 [Mycena haematopus]
MESKDPVFPPELFDLIIDNLGDDLEALRSCALVSSSFYERARVFSHLRVGPLDLKHSIAAFHKLLEGSPIFAARVESLHLWETGSGRNRWMLMPSPSSRKALEAPAGQFMSILINLSRLCITISTDVTDYWFTIPSRFRESIQLTLARPNLTCLELTRIDGLPLSILSSCSALRSLVLTWVTFQFAEHEDFQSAFAACAGSHPTRLEHLSLELANQSFKYFGCSILLQESPIDISCLKSLTCDNHSDNCLTIQSLLDASGWSLQSLRLIYRAYARISVLDLHGLEQLHTLYLGLSPPVGQRLQRLAHSLASPPPERTFGLVLTIGTHSTCAEILRLGDADRLLADLLWITSVTVVLLPADRIGKDPRTLELIDVSDKFVDEMPLLVNRLRGTRALRVLQSPQLSES